MNKPYTHRINPRGTGLLIIIIFILLLFLSIALNYHLDDFPILLAIFSYITFPSLIIMFVYIYFIAPQMSIEVSEEGLKLMGFSSKTLDIPWQDINWLGQFPAENYYQNNLFPPPTLLTSIIIPEYLFAIYLKNSQPYVGSITSKKNTNLSKIMTKDYWKKTFKFSADDNLLPDITIQLGSTNAQKAQDRLKESIRQYAPHLLSKNDQSGHKEGSFPPPTNTNIPAELQHEYDQMIDANKRIEELATQTTSQMSGEEKEMIKQATQVYFEHSIWENRSKASKLLRQLWYGLLLLTAGFLLLVSIFTFGFISVTIGIALATFYWLWVKSAWRQVFLRKSISSSLDKIDVVSRFDSSPIDLGDTLRSLSLWLSPVILGFFVLIVLVVLSPSVTEYGAPPEFWMIFSSAIFFVGSLFSLLFARRAKKYLKKLEESDPMYQKLFSELGAWRDSARQLATKAYDKGIGINIIE